MSAGLASIEEKRAADRQRVAEYLESQRPFTDAEWAAQLRLFEASRRDSHLELESGQHMSPRGSLH